MGNNTTPDRMRGLLVPTANITQKNLWKAQSSFTEMNPRAGVAKASQPFTGLVLEMAGEQSETIKVETVQVESQVTVSVLSSGKEQTP